MLTSDDVWDATVPRLQQYFEQTGNLNTVAEFVGVMPKTVADYLGVRKASGERLIKLWYFLRTVGYSSPELNKLDKYNQYVGELFAFGIVDMQQLLEILNIKQPNDVYHILRGRTPLHPTFLIEDLKPQYGQQLEAAKAAVVKLKDLPPAPTLSASSAPKVQVSESHPVSVGSTDVTLAVELASKLQSGLVIFRFLDSDVCSSETRALVLGLSGDLSEFSKLSDSIQQRLGP